MIRSFLSHLFSSERFLIAECTISFIFVALHWTVSSMSMSLLYLEARNQLQHSRSGFTGAEQRRKITSLLYLLAMLCLTQPRNTVGILYSREHIAGVCSAWCPLGELRVAFCLAAFWTGGPWDVLVLFLPRGRALHFSMQNFLRFLPAPFSSLSRSLWMAAQPSATLATHSSFLI